MTSPGANIFYVMNVSCHLIQAAARCSAIYALSVWHVLLQCLHDNLRQDSFEQAIDKQMLMKQPFMG